MSEPTGTRRYGVGGGDAYYDAVRYGGYEGTREQFGKDQAEFAKNASAVAEAKETVERDTEEVRNTKNTFENTTVPEAIRALNQEGEDQILAITQKGEEVSQQVETVGTEQKDAVANEGRARVKAVQDEGDTQVQAVNDSGTAQVSAVNQAGEDQVDAVEQAGADQVQAVTDEGTTQVGAVNRAGANQIQAVEDKGDEVLHSIPSDYTELVEDVDNLKESITLNSIGKNMIGTVPFRKYPVFIPKGSTITISTSDGKINTVNGQRLNLYNKNGDFVDYFGFPTSVSERTITLSVAKGDIYYISFGAQTSVPLQVEFGSKTTYEPYFPTAKASNGYFEAEDAFNSNNNSLINYSHNYINYGYDKIYETQYFGSGAITSRFGISRYANTIILNNEYSSYSSALRIRLNGDIKLSVTNSEIAAWSDSAFTLKSGHKYSAKLIYVSGTLPTQEVGISVYKVGELTSQGTITFSNNGAERIFTADNSSYNLVLYVSAGATFTNTKYMVVLEDITEDEDYAYYNEELADTIEKVQKETSSPSLVFPWVTDIHRYSNNAAGVQTFDGMIYGMKKIMDSVKCDFLLNTGDLTDGATKAITTQQVNTCIEQILDLGIPYAWVHGNHDTNYDKGYGNVFTIQEIFAKYFAITRGDKYNFQTNGTDYYVDFERVKVRLISIDANQPDPEATRPYRYAYSTNTATWLTNALNTDKTVIVCVHQSPINTQVYNNIATDNSTEIITALQDFVNNGGNLIMLSGHSHVDVAYISPWVSVMQDCERFSDVSETITDETQGMTGFIDVVRKNARISGTATEDCWSVCVYKPIDNELDLIRFGAGIDRYFHITPISPTTVTTKLSGTITWSSSDTAVATVSGGAITGVAKGKCAVLAKDETGNYECWIVEVT